jgi:ribosomal protein S18 acetylase RimI-like enzyme
VAYPFTIEPLDGGDDPAVHDLLVELNLEAQVDYDHPQESRAEIEARTDPIQPTFTGDNVVFVARDLGSRAIGLCWCVLFDPGTGLEGEVAELYVEPPSRNQGVGAALVAAARVLFEERGVSFASVWTRADNPAAVRLYQRHGFKPTEQLVLTWLPLPGEE